MSNSFLIYEQQLLKKEMQQVLQYLQSGIAIYQDIENKLLIKAQELTAITGTLSDVKQSSWTISSRSNYVSHRVHTNVGAATALLSVLTSGICAGIYVGFEKYRVYASKQMKYLQLYGGLSFFKPSLSLDARLKLFSNKIFQPSLTLKAEASMKIAQATVQAKIGNSYLYALGEANVGVGVVKASAQAVINKEEITIKGEIGAAALRGEVKGTVSILGVKITATGTAELGAVGANAEFSSKKGEFEFGGKLSMIAGLGFKIRFSY